MNEASALLRSLRATRDFLSDPISASVQAEIVDVARWTGSARNRKPWRVGLVQRDDERRARFAQTLMLAAHGLGVGSCPVTFFPPENARTATRLIGLTEPWTARTAIAVGCPAPQPPAERHRPAIPTGRHPAEALIVFRD